MDKHAKFAYITKDFDIPVGRRETSQLSHVRWLLHNLRVQNKNESNVDEAIGLLIMISRNFRSGKDE